jgi:hypothetical protein
MDLSDLNHGGTECGGIFRHTSMALRLVLSRGFSPLVLLALAACASVPDAPPVSMPEVISAYTQKVPGRWALAVAPHQLDSQIDAPELACGGMTFAVALDGSMQRYLIEGFHQIADDVTPVDHVLSADEMRAGGYAGLIVVGSAVVAPNVTFAQDGLTAHVHSNLALSATLDVGGRHGVLLHRAFTVNGISNVDAGIVCQNGQGGIGRAADSALQQIAVDAASAFADSADIRLVVASR